MKIITNIFFLISLFSANAATIDFGTTNKITFRCQVEVFEKRVDILTYRAYPGELLSTIIHEQYNSVTGPDIKKLIDLHNGRGLFSNVIISGDGHFQWSVVETDDHALYLEDARWPITSRLLFTPGSFEGVKKRKTVGESDNYLFRIICQKLKVEVKPSDY